MHAFNQTNIGLFSCSLLLIIVEYVLEKDLHTFILEGSEKRAGYLWLKDEKCKFAWKKGH